MKYQKSNADHSFVSIEKESNFKVSVLTGVSLTNDLDLPLELISFRIIISSS